MGFIEDLSEVVRQQETQEDVDWVLAFFQYIESLSDIDDVVDIYLPQEVYASTSPCGLEDWPGLDLADLLRQWRSFRVIL